MPSSFHQAATLAYQDFCAQLTDPKPLSFEDFLTMFSTWHAGVTDVDPTFPDKASWVSGVTQSLAMLCPLPSGELPDIANTVSLMLHIWAEGMTEATGLSSELTTSDGLFLPNVGNALLFRLPPILSYRPNDLFLQALAQDLYRATPSCSVGPEWWSLKVNPDTQILSLHVDLELKSQRYQDLDDLDLPSTPYVKAKAIRFGQLKADKAATED
jgi:hypothetical protein